MVAGSGNLVLDTSALFVAVLRSLSSKARGRHPNLLAAQSVALMRTPAMLFAGCSVMASIFFRGGWADHHVQGTIFHAGFDTFPNFR